jgi:hypothetical protein
MYLQLFGEGSLNLYGLNLILFNFGIHLQPAVEIPKSPARAARECISGLLLLCIHSNHQSKQHLNIISYYTI